MKKFLLPLAAVLLMASGCTKEYVTKQYVTEQTIVQGMDMSLIDFEVKSENWTQRYMDNLNDDEGYYEAILHLENVFNSYRETFFDMKAEQRHVFMEAAYKLGFCYNELGLYKQAFYYLDLMANDGNIRHTMEMVNNMANNKDLRVFNYTDGVMEEVKRNFDLEDELPDNIKDFINFLRRRRGYAYIDFNQLDQAEKIFTKMLDEEDNADYAINELAYIKKLRQQRGENIAPSPQAPPKGDLPF